jgi:2-keto-3-deoxy-L-rhamnonate aldolase RhmA
MNGKELRQRLRNGPRVYCSSILSSSPMWPTALQGAGLDYVFLDTEHVAQDRVPLSWMCRAYSALGLPPVVRMRRPDPYRACQLIDDGAAGVIAPYVESADEVRAMVGAVKLRPLKGERLRQALEDPDSLEPELKAYLEEFNANNVLIVNIESTPAIEALDEILAVPGLDAIQLGPHDLTCSLAVPENYRHPRYHEAVLDIIRRAREKGVGAGVHYWDDLDLEIEYARAGATFVVHSFDLRLACQAMRRDIGEIREALGDKPMNQEDATDVVI